MKTKKRKFQKAGNVKSGLAWSHAWCMIPTSPSAILDSLKKNRARHTATNHNSAHISVITMTKCRKMEFPTHYLAQIVGFWVTCGVKVMSLWYG